MNIISWNVNGIRAVEKKGFLNWLSDCGADVVCIQETKANPAQLSENLISPPYGENASAALSDSSGGAGLFDDCKRYFSAFSSAKKAGYSGTAIYSKVKPDSVENLGDARFDDEGRVTIAKFGKIAVISAYFPNSQEAGARLDYKLEFNKAILKKCDELVSEGFNVVLGGDYNVAHTPIDLANPATNEKNPGYLPEEREWFTSFLNAGYVDTFRKFNSEPKQYTWWSYRFHAREKNIGWRIDYWCVHKKFEDKVLSSTIMADVTGSDHCPIQIQIEE